MALEKLSLLAVLSLVLAAFPASAAGAKTDLWVYTSVYKEYAEPLKKAFEQKNPGVEVHVFQAGSEKIQAKVEAEVLSKNTQADLLMVSDPFWPAELEKRGLVLSRKGKPALEKSYYSAMVMIAHKDFPAAKRPATFKDLAKPEYKGLVQMGSPLESGSTFSTVAILSRKYGWEYFNQLRDNQIASSGGNSTVIQKVESGEKKLGIVLLENALASIKRGSPIEVVYPKDGAVLIPSIQVILKGTPHEEAAAKFSEFLLSKEGQGILRSGYMYGVRKDVSAPEGAPSFDAISKNTMPWTPALIQEIGSQSKQIKRKFAEIVLE